MTTTTLGAAVFLGSRTDVTTDLVPLLGSRLLRGVWSDPSVWTLGLQFSLPLVFILLCHELGHYLACRFYRIPSTLPYFLPSPFFIGTFGAFIRIRGPIRSKKELFDVGIAGPLAGFAALLPFLVLGIAWSTPAVLQPLEPGAAIATLYVPGENLAMVGLSRLFYGDLPSHMILDLHPFALAAWVGLLATALNLIPLGQLDGGHILYAVIGRRHGRLTWPLWLLLLAFTYLWIGWLVWCLLLMAMGLRHPPVADEAVPLDRPRRRLAWLALVLLILSFSPEPLRYLAVGSGGGELARADRASVALLHTSPSSR